MKEEQIFLGTSVFQGPKYYELLKTESLDNAILAF